MNTRGLAVGAVLAVLLAAFAVGAFIYQQRERDTEARRAESGQARLVRMHAPVIGPQDAPVTVVEFFDPACETCRAFYPIVKALMAQHGDAVRLVIRYAPFHHGSDQVVQLLEAARRQNLYVPVLEAVLREQPAWADHGRPNPGLTLQIAEQAGLDLGRAREDMGRPEVLAVLRQDVEDLTALGVNRTPTFFVNGRPLPSFGPEALAALIAEEVARTSGQRRGGATSPTRQP